MDARLLTKIVTVSLFVALSVACQKAPEKEPAAVGASSAMGEKLVSRNYCSANHASPQGTVVFERYQFGLRGELVIQTNEVQNNSTLKVVGEDKGTWGIVNNELFMTLDNKPNATDVAKVESTRRASDQAECIALATNAGSQQLCPCGS